MARLLCKCGEGMSNSTLPSENILEIHDGEAIGALITSGTRLIELYDEHSEYWYCPVCHRVTEIVYEPEARLNRRFVRVCEDTHLALEDLACWRKIYCFTDQEVYEATETDDHITIEGFLRKYPLRRIVRLSPDESRALVYDGETSRYRYSYLLEPFDPVAEAEEDAKSPCLQWRDGHPKS
ncbi:MAG: hypothetical protein IJJ33_13275 [Victivallales bacterium]|nr:hypothetical protein [Victivallales bacterium]